MDQMDCVEGPAEPLLSVCGQYSVPSAAAAGASGAPAL